MKKCSGRRTLFRGLGTTMLPFKSSGRKISQCVTATAMLPANSSGRKTSHRCEGRANLGVKSSERRTSHRGRGTVAQPEKCSGRKTLQRCKGTALIPGQNSYSGLLGRGLVTGRPCARAIPGSNVNVQVPHSPASTDLHCLAMHRPPGPSQGVGCRCASVVFCNDAEQVVHRQRNVAAAWEVFRSEDFSAP